MLRQSLATFTGKFFIAAVNFLTLILTARYLGAEGRGVISLFIINLTIVSMVSNFIDNSSTQMGIKKKYYGQVKKALGAKTAATWFQFEAYMDAAIQFEVLHNIPFMNEK